MRKGTLSKSDRDLDFDQKTIYESHFFNGVYSNYYSFVNRFSCDLNVCRVVGESLQSSSQDQYSQVIVEILSLTDQIVPFIASLIQSEIMKTTNKENLLRGNNLCTKVTTAYLKKVLKPFAKKILSPIIDEMVTTSESYEIDLLRDDKALSLSETQRAETQKVIAMNMKNLVTKITQILTSLLENKNKFPIESNTICNLLWTLVTLKYPDDKLLPSQLVGGILFLRVICAFIATPDANNLLYPGVKLSSQGRRRLVLVSKTLQGISNVSTNSSDFVLDQLKDFLAQQIPTLQDIYKTVSTESKIQEINEFIKKDIPLKSCDLHVFFALHRLFIEAKTAYKVTQPNDKTPRFSLSPYTQLDVFQTTEEKEKTSPRHRVHEKTTSTVDGIVTDKIDPKLRRKMGKKMKLEIPETTENESGSLVKGTPDSQKTFIEKNEKTKEIIKETTYSTSPKNHNGSDEMAFPIAENTLSKTPKEGSNNRPHLDHIQVDFIRSETKLPVVPLRQQAMAEPSKRRSLRRSMYLTGIDIDTTFKDLYSIVGPAPYHRVIGHKTVSEWEAVSTSEEEDVLQSLLKTESIFYLGGNAPDGSVIVYLVVKRLVDMLKLKGVVEAWGTVVKKVLSSLSAFTFIIDCSWFSFQQIENEQLFTGVLKTMHTMLTEIGSGKYKVIVLHCAKVVESLILRVFGKNTFEVVSEFFELENRFKEENTLIPEDSKNFVKQSIVVEITVKGKTKEFELRMTLNDVILLGKKIKYLQDIKQITKFFVYDKKDVIELVNDRRMAQRLFFKSAKDKRSFIANLYASCFYRSMLNNQSLKIEAKKVEHKKNKWCECGEFVLQNCLESILVMSGGSGSVIREISFPALDHVSVFPFSNFTSILQIGYVDVKSPSLQVVVDEYFIAKSDEVFKENMGFMVERFNEQKNSMNL
ncbi:hypothetical protein EIN_475770 [Entamoeba invadens IP1]|uniref:Ras-GAP domain-containing protein n=1 Tax=Entamoeba invadens IP1 TaxID=370355 RepID=A0A0A1U9S2_ENTIV|nr:hypothetical protein EIN_475770 [Entamoeba invadens IP1]ELP88875.1 hypothetical protein EIN_475770 [Entamoeba invadens IP1]|eukprot:XP_004255646.1 hypothetical protein EIN_475770 [Entamoeba invadens IP1]